jgi:hypothetical protein
MNASCDRNLLAARRQPQARFRRSMTTWLRSARDAGLTEDEIEAIYRTALRTCFAEDGVA